MPLLSYLQGPPGVCQSCVSHGRVTYIGKSADNEAAYGSTENPATSCWDLALDSEEIELSKLPCSLHKF